MSTLKEDFAKIHIALEDYEIYIKEADYEENEDQAKHDAAMQAKQNLAMKFAMALALLAQALGVMLPEWEEYQKIEEFLKGLGQDQEMQVT